MALSSVNIISLFNINPFFLMDNEALGLKTFIYLIFPLEIIFIVLVSRRGFFYVGGDGGGGALIYFLIA